MSETYYKFCVALHSHVCIRTLIRYRQTRSESGDTVDSVGVHRQESATPLLKLSWVGGRMAFYPPPPPPATVTYRRALFYNESRTPDRHVPVCIYSRTRL